jgi:hypothetical protein
MPEIKHANEPAIPAPAPIKIDVAQVEAAKVTASPDLEEAVRQALANLHARAVEKARPKEPDWATVTEKDIMSISVNIPVIDHEAPDYMNLKLADPAYEVVWASRDQRRIGQLMATGYELLKPEHIHPDFSLPLRFTSEEQYEYMDVIAMRVHKRILYGKRKKALQVSFNQLSNRNRPPRVKVKNTFDLSEAIQPGRGAEFYDMVGS